MNKRPVSITIIGWIFIASGSVGLVYHLKDFTAQPFRWETFWVSFVRLLAVAGGVLLLRGFGWARWLLLAWLAFHVVVSAFHTVSECMMHALLLAIIGYFLFDRRAAGYFRASR
jgi:hypothetical protein